MVRVIIPAKNEKPPGGFVERHLCLPTSATKECISLTIELERAGQAVFQPILRQNIVFGRMHDDLSGFVFDFSRFRPPGFGLLWPSHFRVLR